MQGGGAHGAFTWGVPDGLLEKPPGPTRVDPAYRLPELSCGSRQLPIAPPSTSWLATLAECGRPPQGHVRYLSGVGRVASIAGRFVRVLDVPAIMNAAEAQRNDKRKRMREISATAGQEAQEYEFSSGARRSLRKAA